ncbi:MAG: aldo/keto reductase [Polyangiaceae bacterium]
MTLRVIVVGCSSVVASCATGCAPPTNQKIVMRYKLLGRSGLKVSELALGTMTFGEEWGFGASREGCKAQLDAFAERGGNFIDTANLYTNGSSERILGELIAPDRDHFVLATKYTLTQRRDDPNASGNSRKSLVTALEASLKRLSTSYIDLLWIHAWDGLTPTEEVMRALDDVVRAGKVLYIGVSDTPAWVVSQSNMLADLRGWSRFVGLQIEYSLIQRTPESELLPMAHALDIAVTPWGAMGGGVLSGKYASGQDLAQIDSKRVKANQARLSEKNLAIAAEVAKIGQEIGRPSTQVALAWVRQQSGVIIPIVGARTTEQLVDNLGVVDLVLSKEHLDRLDAISQVPLGFPSEFLRTDFVRGVVHGDRAALIDNHRAPR